MKYPAEDEEVQKVTYGWNKTVHVKVEHLTFQVQHAVMLFSHKGGGVWVHVDAEVIVDIVSKAQLVDHKVEQETDQNIVDRREKGKDVVVDSTHCLPLEDVQVTHYYYRVQVKQPKRQKEIGPEDCDGAEAFTLWSHQVHESDEISEGHVHDDEHKAGCRGQLVDECPAMVVRSIPVIPGRKKKEKGEN